MVTIQAHKRNKTGPLVKVEKKPRKRSPLADDPEYQAYLKARKKQHRDDIANGPLRADLFYRLSLGPRFFGYSISKLHDAIKSGAIPAPISLSDTGRMKGWFGRTIIAWQLSREKKLVTGDKS